MYIYFLNVKLLLFRLFTVFALWLDDENLQKQEIFLPSLPKQYDTHRLAKIMQRQQVRICSNLCFGL